MPPKQNITKKTTTQKQKQKKAKQQQQQQQGQNVKINIRVGETKKPRAPRKPSDKKQPPKQPPKPPPNVPIQQPQYVPMFLSQQPAQYFTPPVPTTTLPVAPPGTATAPITTIPTAPTAPITPPTPTAPIIPPAPPAPTIRPIPRRPIPPRPTSPGRMSPIPNIPTMTNTPSIELNTFTNFTPRQDIISNFIAFGDLDEPQAFSFNDYANSFSNVNNWVQGYVNEFNDFNDTRSTESEPISISGFIRDFGTQTQDIAPSAMSATLKEMETQTEQFIPPPPPPRQTQQPQQALPPPPIPKEFTAPTQDIQPSAVQSIINLTQENLARLGGLSSSKEYAPSEISDITQTTKETRSTIVDLPALIMESAKKRESMRQQTLDEIIEKRKEKKMEEKKSEGMMGQIALEMEKRRNLLQPPEEEEEIDLSEWEIEKPEPKPTVEKLDKKITRKPGSGRPKGSGNKSEAEREYDNIIKIQKGEIRKNKNKIKIMEQKGLETDDEDRTIADYEQMIGDSEEQINFMNQLIQEEKDRRKLQPIPEFGFEDEEEEY